MIVVIQSLDSRASNRARRRSALGPTSYTLFIGTSVYADRRREFLVVYGIAVLNCLFITLYFISSFRIAPTNWIMIKSWYDKHDKRERHTILHPAEGFRVEWLGQHGIGTAPIWSAWFPQGTMHYSSLRFWEWPAETEIIGNGSCQWGRRNQFNFWNLINGILIQKITTYQEFWCHNTNVVAGYIDDFFLVGQWAQRAWSVCCCYQESRVWKLL